MTETKRPICKRCHYPQKTCLCSAISNIICHTYIDILQHPSEQKCAKNSARLIPLCIDRCRIWTGESDQDFSELRQVIANTKQQAVVLYPSESAMPLTEWTKNNQIPPQDNRIILLDGTWKKAYKMWQLNPWLHSLQHISIDAVTSNYSIRKAPKEHYLSTLEAAAYCIEAVEGSDVSPLYNCFTLMQKPFLRYRA